MISENQIDELFNERLKDYSSSVPADMWSRIVEKKRRDRMIWLFFFGLFALLTFFLGLASEHFIFDQKQLSSSVPVDSMKMNHAPIVTDTMKVTQPNLSSRQDQIAGDKMEADNKKMHPKEKAQIAYPEIFKQDKVNTPRKVNSSNTENRSEVLPVLIDSNEIEKNKAAEKKDSAATKNFIKTAASDSSSIADIKKPGKQKQLTYGKWFLDLYVSPDYPIVAPNQNEKSRLSFSLGLKINRSFGRHFSVKTGIQYSQLNIGSNDSSTGVKPFHIDRIDLPVLVGYSVGDDRFRATLNAGAIYTAYAWFRSKYIPDIYKAKTGLSLYVGVNFERRIKEQLSLFSEPYYRYQLTSMTGNSYGSLRFIDVVGINLGARYYFKKRKHLR